jgi:hypothetical protein
MTDLTNETESGAEIEVVAGQEDDGAPAAEGGW